MYSPVPNGDQLVEGTESSGGSADMDYADDSDDSEGSEEAESPPSTECWSKKIQDPSLGQGKVGRQVLGTQNALELQSQT